MHTFPLQLTEETYRALADLARDTGADGIPQLVTDALRTYEWLVEHQRAGRTIVVLERADMDALRQTDLLGGTRETLVSLLAPDGAHRARGRGGTVDRRRISREIHRLAVLLQSERSPRRIVEITARMAVFADALRWTKARRPCRRRRGGD